MFSEQQLVVPVTKSWAVSLSLMFSVVMLLSCRDENNPDCIDSSRIRQGACPSIYLPVCGCNGVTYGNSCEAGNAGVLEWKQGACP
jgi:hypothetical protein